MIESFAPVYDENSKVLILGSFPSVKSREVSFYYGHKQNRFWDILEALFGEGDFAGLKAASISDKKQFLLKKGIALWDVINTCDITGSADSSIKNVVPNKIDILLEQTDIKVIYCNGKTAWKLYYQYLYPLTHMHAVCLPSTSPANAAYNLSMLIGIWKRISIALNRKDYSLRYYSLNSYAKETYGHKLYKLSLDGGFTCPNRDGTVGIGGCIFCDGDGSGHFAGNMDERNTCIASQIQYQKKLISEKIPQKQRVGYIAYFQAYTGTYASVDYLRSKYMDAVSDDEVEIISIATRPDCLDDDIINLLAEINQIKPVWIELGLQTIHEKTAEYIRRGYALKVYDKAVKRLLNAGIGHIITHVIIGLPGESTEMMLDTVKYVCESGAQGIKLQLLHVLKNTDLAIDYEEGKFEVLSLEQYLDILDACFDIMPADMVVHRLSGDGNKQALVAPKWSGDKKRVINAIRKIAE